MTLQIVSNQAHCKICDRTIYSAKRHDMRTCKCGNLSVDGGTDYLKRTIKEPSQVEELSISIDSELCDLIHKEITYAEEHEQKNSWGAFLHVLRVLQKKGYENVLASLQEPLQ